MREQEFDKSKVLSQLSLSNIYDLLEEWGGSPEYTNFGLIASTICHNLPGDGSRKLYYYENTNLFHCYTGCDASFDIFDLGCKVYKLQFNKDVSFLGMVYIICGKFHINGIESSSQEGEQKEDWKIFKSYKDILEKNNKQLSFTSFLPNLDKNTLNLFEYKLRLRPWLDEGISQEVLEEAKIGYFLSTDQITIPHFDSEGNLVGIRGRFMCQEDCDLYGKYRPLYINQKWLTHALSLNLYNFNLSKDNIKKAKMAIVFEAEKSCMKYRTFFGKDNDISVACCGSSISPQQMNLLLKQGVREIVIALDRQFQEIGDKEFKHLKAKLLKLYENYKSYVIISFIFDKEKITSYKAAPIDEGKEKFLKLFKERIIL